MKKYNHIKGIDLRKLNLFTFDLVSFPGFVIADPYKSFNLCYAI